MITINQAERLRKKSKNQEFGLRRYKALWNKLTRENEKLENVNISEYYIEKKLYGDKLLDQKPFLELLKAPQIRISNTRDFFELVDRYKEINEKISYEINQWKSEGKFPTAYEYLSQMEQEDLWKNFLKVLKFTNTEISPSEIEEYIYEIHPNAVEVLERIHKYCKDIVKEENGKDLFKINKYRYDSTLKDEEISKMVDVSKRLKDVFREKYGIELSSADVLRKIIFELYYSEKEKLKTIGNIPEIFEDEKITERIKAGKELGETRDLIYMYFRNPKFFELLKEGKIDVEKLFDSPPEEIDDNPSFYGRIREGITKNLIDLAAYGREGRDPYHDSEYLRYFLLDGRTGMDYSEIEKKIKAIEKFPFLRKKLRSLSEMLKKWREEGKRYEGTNLKLGAYAKWDGDVNLEKAYNHKVEGDAIGFLMLINQGLKAPSHFGKKIKEFVDELYNISKKAEENPGIFYTLNHWEELSKPEKEYLEKELGIGTNELKRVEEWIMDTPKGVYSEAPPLHSGNRGEDASAIDPRSYYMLDKVFYNHNGDKVGVIEYLVGNGSENDEVRIRVYNFKGKDEFAVEIWKNGKGRFLNKDEVKRMKQKLSECTLPTLFLKGYFEKL